MKGSRLGSVLQTMKGNNLLEIDKDVSSQPQNNINIISGSVSEENRVSTTSKTSCSDTNPLQNSNSSESCNFSSILSKTQFSHYSQPRPRPEHPLTLISFPSTGGNNDPDNEVVTPTPTISANASSCRSGKLFGRISTTNKELHWDEKFDNVGERKHSQMLSRNTRHPANSANSGVRDGWITSEADFLPAKTPFHNRVPKPSHSAKKLAKPYSILIPPNSASSSYHRYAVRGREPPSATLPSSSNNIDNKVVNKPKRNKTARAETGLRKGLSTNSSMPNISSTKRGLLFFSNAKKVAHNTGSRRNKVDDVEDEEILEETLLHGQQSSFNGSPSYSGLRLMSGTGQSNRKVLSGTVNLTKSMSSLSTKLNERVQVIRTAEEREESPETIRMDGMGLKVFPYIGGEGPNLKVLSLQRNLISRLENTPSHLNHLVVLDLYDNRIERVRRIEGFEGLKRLEILDLHGNKLRYLDNLGNLSSLRVLNLAGNDLRSIRNLGPHGIPTLTELNLKRNRIRNLDGLVKAPHLKKLLLANNDLQSFASLLPLRKLSFLQELLLEPNPLSSASDYRQVLTMLPWVSCLDHILITDAMRSEARQWQKRKLFEENERRKEEARLRTVSPTGGPANSREQVIFQARRRWESVKNFVKNTNSKPTNPSSPSLSGAHENVTLDKIGTGGLVRSEIDDDLNSHFRSKSRSETLSQRRNSSKESKSNLKQLVLLEYPGGEVKLNLAQLDSDLDQHQQGMPILVSSVEDGGNIKRMSVPEDSCPPSMINDLRLPQNPKDYVNTNSNGLVSSKQIQDRVEVRKLGLHSFTRNYDQSHVVDHEIGVATQMSPKNKGEAQLLQPPPSPHDGHHNPQMDSSIITKIIKEEESLESAQSPQNWCQPTPSPRRRQMTLTQILGDGDEYDSTGLTKIISEVSCSGSTTINTNVNNYSGEKAMKIAVVRPLLRERNVDETIVTSPPYPNTDVFTPKDFPQTPIISHNMFSAGMTGVGSNSATEMERKGAQFRNCHCHDLYLLLQAQENETQDSSVLQDFIAIMASPASGRILNLLQEVVSIVEQEQRGTPINAVPLPTFLAPMPTVNQNSTQNSPVSVLAELRSRFQPYPSAPSQRFRVAGRSAGRRALFTTRLWSNKFFCLGFPESDKTPNSAQRLYLTTNLLGESVITSEANATSAELSSKIVEQFPKLTGVNFELMRCVGAGGYGKPLVRVSSSNPVPDVAYLKVSRISTIYIRPERPLLRVEEEEDDDVEMNETSTTTEIPIASTSTRDLERNIGTFANATTSTTSLNLADQTWIDMELPTINNFQAQVISLNPGLQVIRVFRDNFYERLFGVYKDPNLNLAKELKVEFLGEAGADYGALKREFFWKGFISLTSEKLHGRALFEGEKDYLVPAADSLLLRTGVFRFVGKFMAHAAIHCGIGFLGLSEAVGEYLTTDEVTPDTTFSITINDLPDPDHKASIEYVTILTVFRPIEIRWLNRVLEILEIAIQILMMELDSSRIVQRPVGRPTIVLPFATIEYLLSVRFKVTDISKIFGVSRDTIFRRMREQGLTVRSTYAEISEDDLKMKITGILSSFPNTGYKRMKGFLLEQGLKLTDTRVRKIMREVDPIGVHIRTLSNRAIVRRQYFVSYFNELWHLDTNMKLIRWNIVIRSCIDGKSRMVVYLDASGDNTAESNVVSFLKAVSKYGIPSRTRSDKGGENVQIAKFMIEQRGTGRSSHICGRSVHNQRIERYWRDVFSGYTGTIYNVLSTLEDEGILDIDNPKHIKILHLVFLPRINQCLETFRNAWNSHPLSSEHNYSPQQLMILTLPPPGSDLLLNEDQRRDVDFVCNSLDDVPMLLTDQEDSIISPAILDDCLTENEVLRLRNIDMLRQSQVFGYDIFVEALQTIL